LKKWCKIFDEKNLAPPYPGGSFGNLSFRTKANSFIITGSRIGLKCSLKNDCFVEILDCNFEQKSIDVIGTREPSSETMLHAAIYEKRPDVGAIFHGHSPKLLANVKKLKIPETEEEKPYGTMELVNSVLEIIDKNDLVMMKNHGFIVVGQTMAEAGELVLRNLAKVTSKI
jgi:ribulose-5-phosphate 4-epimerase/fuculose-1-phosphate aldolase